MPFALAQLIVPVCRPFWDVVVLTASDASQAQSYSAMLEAKVQSKNLPQAEFVSAFTIVPLLLVQLMLMASLLLSALP